MHNIKRIIFHHKTKGLLLFFISVIFFVSLGSYNHNDSSFNFASSALPSNLLSYYGAFLSDLSYQLFGYSILIMPICFCSWSIIFIRKTPCKYFFLRIWMMCFSIIFASIALSSLSDTVLPAGGGGVLGKVGENFMLSNEFFESYKLFIHVGYITISLFCFLFALALPFRIYWLMIAYPINIIFKLINKTSILQKIKNKINLIDTGNVYHDEAEFGSINSENNTFKEVEHVYEKIPPTIIKGNHRREKVQHVQKNSLPFVNLLDQAGDQTFKPQTQSELQKKSVELISVLKDFGVKGQIIDVKEGPVVTMYEFEPSAGTKSSRVIGLAEDIARSLSAVSARISVIPGRNALGIELPNKKRMFFRLKSLIQTEEFNNKSISLPIILGKDLTGSPLVADLAKMPHLLVAGTTGSGKSVAINAMIMSLLYRYTADECKMIMIDPKMLELSAYNNIPHLITPVVTEPSKAIIALKWAVKEMENRYRLMSYLAVRNISNYNEKLSLALKEKRVLERKVQTGFNSETGKPIYDKVPIEMKKMPFIVVIVDEMADLMLVAGKDIESSVQRLAQMARAAGIHIIMATQRPSVDVITGVIKANFPSRVSFKVTSKIDSRTILGEQGAEQLLGMGDMLYMGNSSKILRVHGPFVDDKEVERITNFLRSCGTPEYISAVTESEGDDIEDFSTEPSSGSEDLYSQAVNIVKTERRASISYIQRCLKIGYNKAADLVDKMEKNGVLSSPNNSGKREILLPE